METAHYEVLFIGLIFRKNAAADGRGSAVPGGARTKTSGNGPVSRDIDQHENL